MEFHSVGGLNVGALRRRREMAGAGRQPADFGMLTPSCVARDLLDISLIFSSAAIEVTSAHEVHSSD
jgi:hypothetical protein